MAAPQTAPPKDEEELALESLVFGDEAGFEANLRKIENLYEYSDEDEVASAFGSDNDDERAEDEELFYIDDEGDAALAADADSESAMDVDAAPEEEPAWVDSDDDRTTVAVTATRLRKLRETHDEESLSGGAYVARLRAQYEKIYPRPAWADNWEHSDEEEAAEEGEDEGRGGPDTAALAALLKRTSTFVQPQTKLLAPNKLLILRLKDANTARRSRGGIQSMSFHLLHPLLLTGGFDRTLRVYHIDGRTNTFVLLVHLRDMPVQTCLFAPGRDVVYAGGRRRHMVRWDVALGDVEKISRMYGQDQFQRNYEYFRVSPKGTYVALLGSQGYVNLVDAATGQFAKAYRVDGDVADFAFTRDDKTLLVANRAGDVWEFAADAPTTQIVRRWTDASAVAVTRIALGGNDRWLAVGTESGVVNLFDRRTFANVAKGANPTPFREVGNLVTLISWLLFSPDGQILSVSLKLKKDALKLVHMPLGTVFSNWPTSGTPLGRVTVAEFTPNGQMFAVGNDVGRVTLWRLNHY